MEPSDIDVFDPAHYEKVRRPILEAETLPFWCYTSEPFYRREIDRVFLRSWNTVGRAETIPNPGDYRAVELVGIPLLLARGKDGVIRAFANTCRHRGSQVVSGTGNRETFMCPYHGWTYDLAGNLVGARGMANTEGFDRDDYGLVPVRLETWNGFMFVTFAADTMGLLDWVGDLDGHLASYDMEEMRCVKYLEFEIAANWKVWLEGASEDFHVPTVHRTTLDKLKVKHWTEETQGQYCRLVEEHEGTRAVLPGDEAFPFIPTLTGAAARGTQYTVLYTNLSLATTRDCAFFMEIYPLGVDRTRLRGGFLFTKETLARADFDEICTNNYYSRLDTGVREDIHVAESQQIGLSSRLYRPGRISDQEPNVHNIWNWILDHVLGPESPIRKVVG